MPLNMLTVITSALHPTFIVVYPNVGVAFLEIASVLRHHGCSAPISLLLHSGLHYISKSQMKYDHMPPSCIPGGNSSSCHAGGGFFRGNEVMVREALALRLDLFASPEAPHRTSPGEIFHVFEEFRPQLLLAMQKCPKNCILVPNTVGAFHYVDRVHEGHNYEEDSVGNILYAIEQTKAYGYGFELLMENLAFDSIEAETILRLGAVLVLVHAIRSAAPGISPALKVLAFLLSNSPTLTRNHIQEALYGFEDGDDVLISLFKVTKKMNFNNKRCEDILGLLSFFAAEGHIGSDCGTMLHYLASSPNHTHRNDDKK